MYNKILKNYQIDVGSPFEVKSPHNAAVNILKKTMEETAFTREFEDPEEVLKEAKEEAERQAELIIDEARLEADRITEAAQIESQKKSEAAEEEARNRGFDTGYNDGRLQYEKLIKEAEELKKKAMAEYEEFAKNIEANAVNIVLDIAKKVICDEVSINKENVLLMVKQAFDKSTSKENCILRISTEDYDFIIQNREKLLSMLDGVDNVEIKKDFSLPVGSCVVETPFGTIDAGIQTRMRKIEEAFKKLMGNAV